MVDGRNARHALANFLQAAGEKTACEFRFVNMPKTKKAVDKNLGDVTEHLYQPLLMERIT